MNRLPSIGSNFGESGAVQVAEVTSSLLERTPFALSAPHRLFYPKHFESSYRYPLFLWLHSPDSSEYELDELMPSVSTRNYIGIGLRGSEASTSRQSCFRWSMREASRRIAEELVLSSIQLATEDLLIDSDRVYVGGYGQGGSLAQWIGLRNPGQIAGVVSINGSAPDHPKVLTAWKKAKSLPVLFMYGDSSSICSPQHVANSIQMVHRACLSYQFVQFNCGDSLDGEMASLMDKFMMNPATAV